jgi:hypothetical protein
MIVLLAVLTPLNAAMLIGNMTAVASAAWSGSSSKALLQDAGFTRAVQTVIERCQVNVDLAKVLCN